MTRTILTVWLVLTVACGCQNSAHAQKPPLKQESHIKLYSDAESQAFQEKLTKLKYPLTVETACRELGIDRTRLPPFIGVGSGSHGYLDTQLSENYNIIFAFPQPQDHGKELIDKVTITRRQSKNTEKIK